MKRAMELEPLSVQQGSNYAAVLMYARRFDAAVEQARKTYDLDSSQIGAQNWLCHPLNAKGLHDEAIVIGERAAASQVNMVTSFRACLGIAYARAGQRERSLAIMKEVQELSKTRYVSRYWTAIHYAALGDKESAFAELEKSFQNRDFFLNRIKVDPFMDPLRDDQRFKEMVKRLNLPE
jgi:tetratricopeptide (TPR) repeat protein